MRRLVDVAAVHRVGVGDGLAEGAFQRVLHVYRDHHTPCFSRK